RREPAQLLAQRLRLDAVGAQQRAQAAQADAELVQVFRIVGLEHAAHVRRGLLERSAQQAGKGLGEPDPAERRRAPFARRREGRHRRNLGWPMGLEPTTTVITTLDSTFELRPPLQATLVCPAGLELATPS